MADLGLRKRDYKGLKFFDLTYDIKPDVPLTLSINSREKYSMRGQLSFDRHENSYLFSDEAVISLWSEEAPILRRRAENGTDFRLEIPVPLLAFSQMCAAAQSRIWNYRESKRVKPVREISTLAELIV